MICGPGSSVGTATELRAGRSEIESRWGRDFPPVHTGPGAHPASCKMGTGSFSGVKCGQGVLLTTHSLLVPGHGTVELYLYPPSGPHRACNGITLPLPLPLLLQTSKYNSLENKTFNAALCSLRTRQQDSPLYLNTLRPLARVEIISCSSCGY